MSFDDMNAMELISGYQSIAESSPVSGIVNKFSEIQDVLELLGVLSTLIPEDVDECKITFSQKYLQPLIDSKMKYVE